MKRMDAATFNTQCLKVLDQVADSRTPITITKRGKPFVTLVPYAVRWVGEPSSLKGSILRERGTPAGTGETWDADIF